MPLHGYLIAEKYSYIKSIDVKDDELFESLDVLSSIGTLHQFILLSQHAHRIFSNILEEMNLVTSKCQSLKKRVMKLDQIIDKTIKNPDLLDKQDLPVSPRLEILPANHLLFQMSSRPLYIIQRYNIIKSPPDFNKLGFKLSQNNQNNRRKEFLEGFSNPDYIIQKWVDKHQKEIETERKESEEAGAERKIRRSRDQQEREHLIHRLQLLEDQNQAATEAVTPSPLRQLENRSDRYSITSFIHYFNSV
jgi:hypothetical protein